MPKRNGEAVTQFFFMRCFEFPLDLTHYKHAATLWQKLPQFLFQPNNVSVWVTNTKQCHSTMAWSFQAIKPSILYQNPQAFKIFQCSEECINFARCTVPYIERLTLIFNKTNSLLKRSYGDAKYYSLHITNLPNWSERVVAEPLAVGI